MCTHRHVFLGGMRPDYRTLSIRALSFALETGSFLLSPRFIICFFRCVIHLSLKAGPQHILSFPVICAHFVVHQVSSFRIAIHNAAFQYLLRFNNSNYYLWSACRSKCQSKHFCRLGRSNRNNLRRSQRVSSLKQL